MESSRRAGEIEVAVKALCLQALPYVGEYHDHVTETGQSVFATSNIPISRDELLPFVDRPGRRSLDDIKTIVRRTIVALTEFSVWRLREATADGDDTIAERLVVGEPGSLDLRNYLIRWSQLVNDANLALKWASSLNQYLDELRDLDN